MRTVAAFALLLCCTAAWAQPERTQWSTDGPVDLFTTDELGNLYTLRGNDLDLYDRNGKPAAHNSLNSFGPISGIDAFSSLKPLIFSRAQGRLALLDNTLSVQGTVIDLPRSGFPQVALACVSVGGRFWFYDEREMALLRVDAQLKPVANTGRLDQLLFYTPQPTYMAEADGRLYLVDPARGVLVFDLFGTYLRTLPVLGCPEVQVEGGLLWYVAGGKLGRYDLRTLDPETVPWPAALGTRTVHGARVEHGRLYCRTDAGVFVFPVGP
jgi:hypothetical protein